MQATHFHLGPAWLEIISHVLNKHDQEFWKGSLKQQQLKQILLHGVELDFLIGITWPFSFELLH